ncbi:hypothetical protein ASD97_25875 [Streptomyces sp. Root63]|uniref:hypothetical protein n=1 Tax=unclassified Streptomyces TaxID=2593676 RepID=UPI000701CEB7|nr:MULTISPECIES: hypothetical protein [unclassified Streptomyces]KQX43505.1 hypothetical protein ASD29_32180 [Streptomyces sp. Root1295]KRA34068.1 hypothetical protein ASD97_25875 [Streptomyces sp. Root63]
MEDDYEKKFQALTQPVEKEGIYEKLSERAQFLQVLAVHCAMIYKVGRKAGLSRQMSRYMAREYFRFEMTPENYYPGEGGK